MEHVGESVIAQEVVNPGRTAFAHDALVESANVEVQPQSGDCSDGLLQDYPTDTNPSQPAPLLPFPHVAFPAMTNQNIQTPLEGVVYSEGLPQAYTSNISLAQPTAVLPHHHNLPESTLSPHNIQVQPEDVQYWKNLSQYCEQPAPAPAHSLSTFPQWPEPNVNSQAQTEGYLEGLPQAYKDNSTHPAPPLLPHEHQAFPSWPEQQNVQVQQSDRYWDGALRPPLPYSLTISSMYHGLQCQDGAMLQSRVLSAGYAYETQQWSCIWPTDSGWIKPAPPEYTCDDRLLLTLIDGTEKTLPYVGLIDENHGQQLKDDLTYIKKPPNAFMLFLEEQRPLVEPELRHQGTSKVNKALGKKWKSLTVQEKAKYFHHARLKALYHKQLYPGWNNSKNYGKRRKRKRNKDCEKNDAITPVTSAVENTPQAITVEKSDLLNSLVWTLLDQDDTTETDLVPPTHVHHTADLATLEEQRVMLDEHPPHEAAIEMCPLQDTLDQDRKALFPFLTGDTFDLSTEIENLEFWHDGFLSNGLQDSYC